MGSPQSRSAGVAEHGFVGKRSGDEAGRGVAEKPSPRLKRSPPRRAPVVKRISHQPSELGLGVRIPPGVPEGAGSDLEVAGLPCRSLARRRVRVLLGAPNLVELYDQIRS